MGSAREVVETMYRACNAGDVAGMLDCYDDNATYSTTAHTVHGKSQLREYFTGQLATFPGLQFAITNVIESGDRVVVEYRVHGTHGGPLPTPSGTIPPTGKLFELSGVELYVVRDGKIVTDRNYVDRLDLLRQLGLLPGGAARGDRQVGL